MKKLIILFLFFYPLKSFSQIRTDAVSLFKMQLFLDRDNSVYTGMDRTVIKSDSLYWAFRNAIDVELDTLRKSFYYDSNIKFYRLRNVLYKRFLSADEEQFFLINGQGKMVLAIDEEIGKSYRIAGFNGNDFLTFISDYCERYSIESKLSISYFLRHYYIEDVDIQCLYKGLKEKTIDRIKYPCLKRPSDVLWIR